MTAGPAGGLPGKLASASAWLSCALLLSGWGFFFDKPEVSNPEPVTLRDIPLGMYEYELRYRKGDPDWQTADGELIYEEATASYSVTLNPDTTRVVRVCEVGDRFRVLGIRGGDSLTTVIETVGMPSNELLNRDTTEGQLLYSDRNLVFRFRAQRVQEVCVLDQQQQQQLLSRRRRS